MTKKRSGRRKPVGWRNHSDEHALASRGIKTKQRNISNIPRARGKDLWEGTDVCLATSLDEYGFVAKKGKNYPDEYFVLYKTVFGYDFGWIRESELDDIVLLEGWADEEDIDSFLSTVGSTKDEWLRLNFVSKLSDMFNYWGYQNFMGDSYQSIGRDEAFEMIGINPDDY